jgi:hypothetical protein
LSGDILRVMSYVETQSGNRIHRKSVLCGAQVCAMYEFNTSVHIELQRIHLEGKTIVHAGVMLRGDFAKITSEFQLYADWLDLLRVVSWKANTCRQQHSDSTLQQDN